MTPATTDTVLSQSEVDALLASFQTNAEQSPSKPQIFVSFDDLSKLDSTSLKMVLNEVAHDDLVVILKTSSSTIKQIFFEALPDQHIEAIKCKMNSSGPIRLSDAEASQTRIVQAAQKLVDSGQVTV